MPKRMKKCVQSISSSKRRKDAALKDATTLLKGEEFAIGWRAWSVQRSISNYAAPKDATTLLKGEEFARERRAWSVQRSTSNYAALKDATTLLKREECAGRRRAWSVQRSTSNYAALKDAATLLQGEEFAGGWRAWSAQSMILLYEQNNIKDAETNTAVPVATISTQFNSAQFNDIESMFKVEHK